jgi:hypothetical protein
MCLLSFQLRGYYVSDVLWILLDVVFLEYGNEKD